MKEFYKELIWSCLLGVAQSAGNRVGIRADRVVSDVITYYHSTLTNCNISFKP